MALPAHASGSEAAAARWRLAAFAAFVLIACGLFAAATLADRAATLAQGGREATNAAALLAERADRMVRIAQVIGAQVVEEVRDAGPESFRLARWEDLARLGAGAPEVGGVALVGPDGRLAAVSTQPGIPPLDVADRPWFATLRDGGADHLSGLQRGRLGGNWTFGWNIALRGPDRALAGVVHVALRDEALARDAAALGLPEGAGFKLVRADGLPLMVWPRPATEAALPLPPIAMPVPDLGAGLRAEEGPDGARRLIAWRAAPSAPMVAAVAVPEAAMLAPFRARLMRNLALFGAAMGVAALLAAAALRAGGRAAAARRAAEERGGALAAALAERQSLLASLQEGEARLRLAEQAGGIGLWDWQFAAGRIALAGDAFAAWGLPVPAGGRDFRALPVRAALRAIHPDDRAATAAALAGALREMRPLAAEFRLAGPGPERWIGVRAEPQPGGDGWPARLIGIALDVTATRREARALAEAKAELEGRVAERTRALAEANAQLREGEARFRGLFNATFQFIGLLSPDGTVLEANAAMLRLARCRATEVVGRPYWEAPWWPDDAATRALVRAMVADAAAGHFARRETAMRDARGEKVAVDFSVTPVRDEDGIVSLLVPEARDISALKGAQALLHEAQKMDTLGQLTGGVAHDFNNLLMAVLGNLALARRRIPPEAPELRRAVELAAQAAERGASLTKRLLAFARRQDLRPQPTDLRALLTGIEGLLRRSAGPLVELGIEAPEGLPPAQVDPHALELALVNLAVNARDAMPPEGGRVEIRLALADPGPAGPGAPPRLPPGRYLSLSVADTGHGMDAATLARAAEPFFTTKAAGQGTGLGLSMVHGLAAQSGGALVLRSAVGQGTTATLWLPVATGAPVAAPPPAEPEPAAGAGGHGTVLVVDDEPMVLESTAAMLEELGYEAVRAETAEAALALLGQRGDVVAVLTDHAMPGMTGAALARRLRRERPGLPVILATGYAAGWVAEPDGPQLLSKPYGLAQLAAALEAVVRPPA